MRWQNTGRIFERTGHKCQGAAAVAMTDLRQSSANVYCIELRDRVLVDSKQATQVATRLMIYSHPAQNLRSPQKLDAPASGARWIITVFNAAQLVE